MRGMDVLGVPPIRVTDWEAFAVPEGYKAEIIRAELVVTPAPSVDHGRVHDRLVVMFNQALPDDFVTVSGPEWRLDVGGAVAMAPQPDLLVVRRPAIGKDIRETPLLAVEILLASDSDRLADGRTRRAGKLADYAANGLADYLEVDLTKRPVTIIRYERRGRELVEADRAEGNATLRSDRPFPYALVPAAL